MKVEKALKKEPQPVSFRITTEAHRRLKRLGDVLEKSKSQLVEEWILEAYEAAEKKFPKELRALVAKESKG